MAQLVARDIWDVDAAGSNPVTPTSVALDPIRLWVQRYFFLAARPQATSFLLPLNTFPADLIFNVKSAGLFRLDL